MTRNTLTIIFKWCIAKFINGNNHFITVMPVNEIIYVFDTETDSNKTVHLNYAEVKMNRGYDDSMFREITGKKDDDIFLDFLSTALKESIDRGATTIYVLAKNITHDLRKTWSDFNRLYGKAVSTMRAKNMRDKKAHYDVRNYKVQVRFGGEKIQGIMNGKFVGVVLGKGSFADVKRFVGEINFDKINRKTK